MVLGKKPVFEAHGTKCTKHPSLAGPDIISGMRKKIALDQLSSSKQK